MKVFFRFSHPELSSTCSMLGTGGGFIGVFQFPLSHSGIHARGQESPSQLFVFLS